MAHKIACERVPVSRVKHLESMRDYCEKLEHNQKLASCCRDTQNHEIEARYSSEEDAKKGIPDIYIMYCLCGRQHRTFCVGGGDVRPFWDRR
jgi:hypothetical protein